MSKLIERVADAVIKDLTGRRGFRQAWDECDGDIQEEIRLGSVTQASMLHAGRDARTFRQSP